MSTFDHSLLLPLIHYKEFPIIFQQWPRLSRLFGQKKALEISKNMLEHQSAQQLKFLTDQDLVINFNLPQPKMEEQYSENSQHSYQTKNIRPHEKSNKSFSKTQNSEKIIAQIVPKEKDNSLKQQDDKGKMRKVMIQYLRQYKRYSSLSQAEIVEVVQITFQYQKCCELISKSKLSSRGRDLRNTFFDSKQTFFSYLQLVDSALYYSSDNHRLRYTQIMALILFLFKNKDNRVLLEILTGQGKSTIVSCLAAILTINGKRVDIVTTNEILAKRDVEEKKIFYGLLNIQVCHNFQQNQKGPKTCYDGRKIIYGTPHSFQVDILMDQYKKRGTRCKRPFDILIVDEVDSMFVDQKDHQTLLSTTYPGFSELIHPMKIIWNKISTYPIFKEDEKIKMIIPMGPDKTITGEAKEIMKQVIADLRKTFQNQIIPEWRMDFINQSLENWMYSAIKAAFVLKQKQNYCIRNNNIVPIDYKNTGAIQQKVHWQNGLHQFLQIKHGLNVSTEGMTSNFISNLGHFDKYSVLFGLTGTLGSDQSKKFLVQTYKVELMKIPPFKERRLQIHQGMVLYDEVNWARYIIDQIQNMVACDRSVLLICESIHEVQLIKIAVTGKIKLKAVQYILTGEEKVKDLIHCGELIAATNLAGRGTDLKITKQLNERGGLHVIIGFMPSNLRVQMQGRGRAGRNGCEGSSELAVNYKRYCSQIGLSAQSDFVFHNSPWSDPSTLTQLRDQIEQRLMQDDRKKVQSLRCKDKMFNMYCKGMNSIPDFQDNHAKQLALQQQWAMFLKKAQNKKTDIKQAFGQAEQLVRKLVQNSDSYYNPNHYVSRGLKQMCDNNNKAAIGHFKQSMQHTGSITRIVGGTLMNSCQLNQNAQDKGNVQNCMAGFAKTKQQIKAKVQMNKGIRLYDNQNRGIVNHHANQLHNRQALFQRRINQDLNHQNAQIFNNQMRQLSIQESQISQAPNIQLQNGQERLLNALHDQIERIEQKICNLGKNQYVKIQFQPIDHILDNINGDKKQNEQALQKLKGEGLHLLPVPVVCKKKVKWWKRVLVFALGVVQIICGAIILASTAGALTGFGVSMMVSGATQCFDAIFRPQLLEDLGKYYGKVALNYTFALAMSGIGGITELAQLSKNGFTMLRNMPFKDFLATTFTNVKTGIGMFPAALASLSGGGRCLLSSGLSSLLTKKDNGLKEMISNPVKRVQKNGQKLKSKVDSILKEENIKDRNITEIKQTFERELTKIIKKLLSELDKNLLVQIKNLKFDEQQIYIIISKYIKQGLKLPQSSSPQARTLVQLFKKEIGNVKLAQMFAQTINLRNLMKKSIQEIKQSENYEKLVELRTMELILNALEKLASQKKTILQNRKQQLDNERCYLQSNKNSFTIGDFNKKVEAFNSSQTLHLNDVDKFNKFITQQYNKPREWLYEKLKSKNAFDKNGRVNVGIVNQIPLHQYTKQALSKIEYFDSTLSFEQSMENAIYNEVVNYGLLIIEKIHGYQQQISKKVTEISDLINQ